MGALSYRNLNGFQFLKDPHVESLTKDWYPDTERDIFFTPTFFSRI